MHPFLPSRPNVQATPIVFLCALILLVGAPPVRPQAPPTPPESPAPVAPSPEAPAATPGTSETSGDSSHPKPVVSSEAKRELDIQDSGTTFRLRVNLVQVHVTVRDTSGKPVENLRKEDFLLYDQGKLQTISTFAIETRQSRQAKAEAAAKTQVEDSDSGKPATTSPVIPDRFVAVVFDDTHFEMSDIANLRVQVGKFLDTIAPTDRIAIFSTSGELTQDYTSDKELLRRTLLGLVPRARFLTSTVACPDVSFYEGDQIINYSNAQIFDAVVYDTIQCAFNGASTPNNYSAQIAAIRNMVQSAAQQALLQGETESQYAFSFMQDVIRNLASRPGERVLLLASPGFLLTIAQHIDLSTVVDLANRNNVVINALDGRGLYTPDQLGDVSKPTFNNNSQTAGVRANSRIASQSEQAFVLGDLAY